MVAERSGLGSGLWCCFTDRSGLEGLLLFVFLGLMNLSSIAILPFCCPAITVFFSVLFLVHVVLLGTQSNYMSLCWPVFLCWLMDHVVQKTSGLNFMLLSVYLGVADCLA